MRIIDLLDKKSIQLNAVASGKKDVLDQAVTLMGQSGKIQDIEKYRRGVYKREEESTTGIGEGIAIPHCKSDAVIKPGLAAMVIPDGVEFDSLDGEPVKLLFLIAAPDTKENVHLDVLSKLSVLLMDEDFTSDLMKAASVEEFLKVIDEAETEKDDTKETAQDEKVVGSIPYVLAVTGCPTGIAHTYMAAEALEKKARELGCRIKVETRGSGGAKNILTEEDIETLRSLAQEKKVVAIGEIGLDYYLDNSPREVQKKWFERQLELAREVDLPVIIHSREAAKDTMDIMREAAKAGNTGVIHCYSYAAPMAKEYISMGFFIGIGGVLTFKNARVIKEVASEIPLSSIVLETDSPYLAPVPYRGKRNNSMYLKEVVKQLAQIKQVSEETVITTTLANAKRLYRLEENCG